MNLDELKEAVRGLVDAEDKEMAAAIAGDLAVLGARAAAGEDVSGELAHVKAQALNLAAEHQSRISSMVLGYVNRVVSGVVLGVLS